MASFSSNLKQIICTKIENIDKLKQIISKPQLDSTGRPIDIYEDLLVKLDELNHKNSELKYETEHLIFLNSSKDRLLNGLDMS